MHRILILSLLLAAPVLRAESLSEADREALIEKLDKLRDTAREKAMGRIGAAAAAYREGMASDEAAAELYVKCVEKVEFEDRQRSSKEFRDWKRHHDDQLKDPARRRCLRHQLRWLLLSLEAAEAGEKREALAPKAAEALEAIFGNPEQFDGKVDTLREPVTATVFAKAYNLGGARLENWPLSPLEIGAVFEQVIFPPLARAGKFEALRGQWAKRMGYESAVLEFWSGRDPKDGPSPEQEKFSAETLPELEWRMENALYAAGDERRAALNMLEHLGENLGHPKVREWGEEFRKLVDPPDESAAAE
jgi:hypothetical protein